MVCHNISKYKLNNFIIGLLFLMMTSFLFAQERDLEIADNSIKARELSGLQKQARFYRDEGLELQRVGNLDEAMSLYQRAIKLDPLYAVAYNDLGIIYEAKGFIEQAEESYLKAIKLDPNFLSAYSNLALLYENKRDLDKAYFYWQKRLELGSPADPWTQKAKNRVDELIQVIPALKQRFIEQQTIALMEEIAEKKRIKKLEEMKESEKHLVIANKFYKNGEYKQAIDEINLAISLNPEDQNALTLLDKAKTRLREQEKKANIRNMQQCFQDGIKYYQQDNLQAAKQKFEKLVELSASPQKN